MDFKNETAIDTLDFAKETDLASLKYYVDKLNIDKLKNVPTNLRYLKSEVHKLGVDKLRPFPGSLIYVKIKNFEDKVHDITNLATTSAVTAVENKMPNVSNLVQKKWLQHKKQ